MSNRAQRSAQVRESIRVALRCIRDAENCARYSLRKDDPHDWLNSMNVNLALADKELKQVNWLFDALKAAIYGESI